jgi:multiple sugar transport system ATP-binding protein
MAEVTIENVKKVYPGGVEAVKGANIHIANRVFVVLVGPSGCGKTTTLRMIAGLEEITSGTISIGGRIVNDVAPKDRDIAYVFQNYALYPHMSVFDNMAFGLKLRGFPKKEIIQRVDEAAKILGITELLQRKPKALSGGQRQRVAVGRAIVRQPAAFLFDEPLSNLDAKLRVEMRVELNKLHQRLATTMIYVTHDQIEAMTLGDRIVIMKLGVIQQIASPLALYEEPINQFVAAFIGAPPMNFLDGNLEMKGAGVVFTDGAGVTVPLPEKYAAKLKEHLDQPVRLGVRPEHILLKGHGRADVRASEPFTARVEVVESLGSEKIVYFSLRGHRFIGKLEAHVPISESREPELVINADKVHIFSRVSDAPEADHENVNLTCGVERFEEPKASLREPEPAAAD